MNKLEYIMNETVDSKRRYTALGDLASLVLRKLIDKEKSSSIVQMIVSGDNSDLLIAEELIKSYSARTNTDNNEK